MTPETAEKIFNEFGDVLAESHLNKPEQYSELLKRITRMELRKAILIWVAKQKYEGFDILLRREFKSGKKAILELADNVYIVTSLFGKYTEQGLPIMDSDKEEETANTMHDEMVNFILNLNCFDSNYWDKINLELNKY